MGSEGSAVTLRIEGSVATIRLNRPAHGNGFNLEFVEALAFATEVVSTRADLRCLVIRAEGKDFSVGGDITFFAQHDVEDYGDLFAALIDRHSETLLALEALEIPIVAGVRGWTVGAGLALLGVADLVLAADDARFRTAFAGIGLPGDAGVTWYLARVLGLRRAMSLILENNVVTADEAIGFNLITRVVPRADLDASLDQLAQRIAAGPTRALGHARRNVRHALTNGLGAQLLQERSATVACAATHDLRAAIESFSQRQTPVFEGR